LKQKIRDVEAKLATAIRLRSQVRQMMAATLALEPPRVDNWDCRKPARHLTIASPRAFAGGAIPIVLTRLP
jgi:hypothetical protein